MVMSRLQLWAREPRHIEGQLEVSDDSSRRVVQAIGFSGLLTASKDFTIQEYTRDYTCMDLEDWPVETSQRLVAFYSRYFQRHPAESGYSWNSHSLVAAVSGNYVAWSKNCIPNGLQAGEERDAGNLIGGQPYVIARDNKISHSFLSLAEQGTLSIPGRGRSLQVMSATALLSIYEGSVFDYTGLSDFPYALEELTKSDEGMYDLPNPGLN
jgi:hypothetical protein